jgi:cytoskeletal protein RodZ
MDEKNEMDPPPRYKWPWFVLGMVVLGFVLAVIWMTVLVRRTSEERDFNMWPPTTQPVPQTNSTPPKTNADSVRTERMAEFRETLFGGCGVPVRVQRTELSGQTGYSPLRR